GHARIPIIGWMRNQATEGMNHAAMAGEHVTSLGGHPSLNIGKLVESHKHDITQILGEALDHERATLREYYNLLALVVDKSVWLESRPQVRRLPQRLRSQPHFGWKLRAPVEVRADVLGEILPTPRAYIRPATERIGGEFHGPEAEESAVTLMASSALAQSSHR